GALLSSVVLLPAISSHTEFSQIPSTAQQLPEHQGTSLADHLGLSPYSLQSPVHCVFKTPTRLDSEPIPTIFSPAPWPQPSRKRDGSYQFFKFRSSIHRYVGV